MEPPYPVMSEREKFLLVCTLTTHPQPSAHPQLPAPPPPPPHPTFSRAEWGGYTQDMRGYLRIRNVLSAEEVVELNAAFDLMEDMDQVCDSDTVNPYGGGMDGHERGSLRGMLEYPDAQARPFRNLIADERLTPYLNTLFGPGWHLADQPFLSVQENGSGGQVPCTTLSCSVRATFYRAVPQGLHGFAPGGYAPGTYFYQCNNGAGPSPRRPPPPS